MFAERNFHDVYQVSSSQIWGHWLFHFANFLIVKLQALNIPVPDAVTLNHVGEDGNDAPPTKRARTAGNSTTVVQTTVGTKVLALPSGTVNCNAPICDLIKIVKPVIRALVEDSNLLKMWISFMIPKIEDGKML